MYPNLFDLLGTILRLEVRYSPCSKDISDDCQCDLTSFAPKSTNSDSVSPKYLIESLLISSLVYYTFKTLMMLFFFWFVKKSPVLDPTIIFPLLSFVKTLYENSGLGVGVILFVFLLLSGVTSFFSLDLSGCVFLVYSSSVTIFFSLDLSGCVFLEYWSILSNWSWL